MKEKSRGGLRVSMKEETGITLIALIITIIILVILAAVSIRAAYNSGIINYAVNGTENYISAAEREKEAVYNAQIALENAVKGINPFVGREVQEEINGETVNVKKGENVPKITEGMIPIKWNGTKWVVCARDDKEWYDYASVGEIAVDSTRKMAWANMMLSDGKYKAGTVEVGQEIEDNELGSMFVWIPRYAYSMTHYKSTFSGIADSDNGKTQEITNVVFLRGTTNEDVNGNVYAKDYNADTQTVGEETEKIVHPAFTFEGRELTRNMGCKI